MIATNVPLRGLIMFAFQLEPYDTILGGSSLLEKRFDVVAKAAAPVAVPEPGKAGPLNVMMQKLLAERFGLVTRWEERTVDGYALVRSRADGRLGPQIRATDLECPRTSPAPPGDTRTCSITNINGALTVPGHQIAALTRHLSEHMDQRIVDRTGLVGWFELQLTFDARSLPFAERLLGPQAQPNPRELPSLFSALPEQLGLKLERQKLSLPVLIIEQVREPSEN